MRNYLNQQVRQVAQRSAEEVVHPLGARVRRDLGGQTRKQPSQRLGTVALQSEEVLELADVTPSMIWRLPEAQRRSAFDHALRESFLGVAATSAPYCSIQWRSHSTPVKPLSGKNRKGRSYALDPGR